MADATLPGFEPGPNEDWEKRVKQLNEAREERAATTTPAILMPEKALKFSLMGNQFKNRFEPESLGGIGAYNPMYDSVRRQAEEHFFGIPHHESGEKRPIYGFLRKKGDLSHSADSEYGDVTVDIRHPKPGENVTTTIGDSLNNYGRYMAVQGNDTMDEDTEFRRLRELDERDPEPLTPGHHGVETPDSLKSQASHYPVEYREIQWHDRPKPREDITGVHIKDDLGSTTEGYPETRIQKHLEQMKNKASEFRHAGLPSSTPVTGHIEFSHYQPGLFDHLEGARENKWYGDWNYGKIEKNL